MGEGFKWGVVNLYKLVVDGWLKWFVCVGNCIGIGCSICVGGIGVLLYVELWINFWWFSCCLDFFLIFLWFVVCCCVFWV